MILLDTDVLIDLLRGLPQAIKWFNDLGDEEIVIPGFVMMELIQGCRTKEELRNIKSQVKDMSILWPSQEDCDAALSIYSELGQLALSTNAPLHTFNQKHSAIPNLAVVMPYERQ